MLPILILALSVLVLASTMWRLVRAPEARRGKRRITPRTPAGIHMPGPSFAPVFAAIGVFLFFLGLVFGGTLLVLGGIALVLTLLYWLVEALRVYDHDLGRRRRPCRRSSTAGPPPACTCPARRSGRSSARSGRRCSCSASCSASGCSLRA